ncbi:hypothetical protein QQS21_001620 [Conoideocrella luteorostrata]|uniref:Cwf18 pre-mRNA splicing factor-domain-containing protein n=1 Tax=Conoideocrella luteorostrata TaxID=1105319 RepID=A0AAJ0CWV3_9HYPO|nr:hypothetical protein QQS21_001620 [Conoideocrella luteorostrata]
MSSSLNTLSAASEDRKSRLAALRNLKRKQPDDEVGTPDTTEQPPSEPSAADITRLHLSGRNYDPETKGPKLGFDQAPNEYLEKPTLEEQAAVVETGIRQQAAAEALDDKGLDLFKLQPRKPNWDLKRNLESKLDILNVRTDNAIARLVRERIVGAQKAATNSSSVDSSKLDGDSVGMDGIALVEGLRVREQEEEEEERRELEEDAALMA